ARQYRTGDGAATGADHGVLFPIGHAGTRCQTECGNGGCCNERDAIHCFHLFTSSVKVDRCSCKYGCRAQGEVHENLFQVVSVCGIACEPRQSPPRPKLSVDAAIVGLDGRCVGALANTRKRLPGNPWACSSTGSRRKNLT